MTGGSVEPDRDSGSGPPDDDRADDVGVPHRADAAEPELLEVGRVVKPHGLRGEVIVALTTNRDERVARGSRLSADGRQLRVERSAPHRGRFIVSFEGVSGVDAAEELRDTRLFAPPLDDPDALWVHQLIGARVVDVGGRPLGTVEAVQANPASDLLELDSGDLIPLRFVVSCEPGELITVDPPEGLVDPA